MEETISDKQLSKNLLVASLVDVGLLAGFTDRYKLPNGTAFAHTFNKLGWYIFDDGHVVYRTRYKGTSNFEGVDVLYLTAILSNFNLVAEMQEDNELVSYFTRK